MRPLIKKKYHQVEIRFIPYYGDSWVMQYKIRPDQLKWWQKIFNTWVTPRCRYLGTTRKHQNPLEYWLPITIESPQEVEYYRDRFRLYKDLLEYAHSYDELFKNDVQEYEQFKKEHDKIL